MRVRVPVAMTSEYQNSPIARVGVNTPTEQLQEQTLQETNHNEEETPVNSELPPASVDDVESVISEDNCETTIVEENMELERMTINVEH